MKTLTTTLYYRRLVGVKGNTARARLPTLGALGQAASEYVENADLSPESRRSYALILERLALDFPTCEVQDFNPPDGVIRVREFLARHWGHRANESYNGAHSTLHSFFKHEISQLRLIADPTPGVKRRKRGMPKREIFTDDEVTAIFRANFDLRDRVALRLLLDWGISKGGLQQLHFGNFDQDRGLLVARATKGRQYVVPIPDDGFWNDVRKLIDTNPESTQPRHYLLPHQTLRSERRGVRGALKAVAFDPEQPRGYHGLHLWWYRCLQRAQIVPPGVTRGQSMKKARQTAGQRWLDKTRDLKSVQAILGHASIQTTWTGYSSLLDIGHLADQVSKVLEDEASASA